MRSRQDTQQSTHRLSARPRRAYQRILIAQALCALGASQWACEDSAGGSSSSGVTPSVVSSGQGYGDEMISLSGSALSEEIQTNGAGASRSGSQEAAAQNAPDDDYYGEGAGEEFEPDEPEPEPTPVRRTADVRSAKKEPVGGCRFDTESATPTSPTGPGV